MLERKFAKISLELARHGQYLPFDPILSAHGSTLGGAVAAGVSGSGRYRYGGVRDFLLGVQFLDGKGRLVRGGGKVVKNAAGFDLPKLMAGSLGRLGILVELTFKVFPEPEAYATVIVERHTLPEILDLMQQIAGSRLDLSALDITPGEEGFKLQARLGGLQAALRPRLARLTDLIGLCQILLGDDDLQLWQADQEFSWVPANWSLVKTPLTPGRIPAFDAALESHKALRRYSGGGQVAWVALSDDPKSIEALLRTQRLSGLVLFGPPGAHHLGDYPAKPFLQRVKQALDPDRRFLEV